MSQAAMDVVEGTFLEKYDNELKDLLPETEQLIKELSMPEEIKGLGKKIDCEITEEQTAWAAYYHEHPELLSASQSMGKVTHRSQLAMAGP
jgi:hypothetical protein